jgi:starvation-inducible DNA-binding protein
MTTPTLSATSGAATATADALARLLADTYTLYLKTHGYHWNVTGPQFPALHLMFETQYTEMALAVDEIAERIRTVGAVAPGSYRELARLSSVVDEEGAPEATEMVRRLITAHETVVASAEAVVEVAEPAGDIATVDLATQRVLIHQKTLWMLRATIA